MDWNRYKPLLATANAKLIALTFRTQLATQPPDVEKVVACLQDGSIDPGDFQQVTQGLMTIIRSMPEYQDVLKFTRASRQEYSALYRELAAASDDEYTAFVELNQQSAIEMMTEALFGLLVKHGLLVDKRGRAPLHAVAVPADPEVDRLQAELDRNRACGDHVKAIETIKQLVEVERDPMRRGGWFVTAGEIYRDQLADREQALEHFNMALDLLWSDEPSAANAWTAIQPLQAIDQMLTEAKDWKSLERSYRKHLVRMRSYVQYKDAQAELWEKLGEVYRTRLDSATSAEAAFEQARSLRG